MSAFVKAVLSSSWQRPQEVNSSTIRNKVLAGYQGWAGARGTWDHWTNDGQMAPSATDPDVNHCEHFEMIPQMGEYPLGALQATGFKYHGNGSVVNVYANAAEGVVDLHFQWMKDYGMDGVLLQRFISDVINPGKGLDHFNTILAQADAAAAKHGRTYAIMYDMSGAASTWDTDIDADFVSHVKNYTSSERYLKEKGRPVVCIFGLGLVDHAQATVDSSLRFIRSLQANGFYVIGSGPYYWREGTHDALPGYSGVFTAFDAIMPWSVGRYSSALDFSRLGPLVEADAALTQSRGQGYAPIAFPGYSYRDTNKINFIRRYAGQFFRAQIDVYLNTSGVSFYYIAMFDEVHADCTLLDLDHESISIAPLAIHPMMDPDGPPKVRDPMQVQEGTAIYKFAANDAESAEPGTSPQGPRPFVTASIDGVEAPGDLYLTIAGQFAAAARGGPPLPPMPPIQI